MRVLVWQSYGITRVYEANTDADLDKVIDRIATGTKSWNLEDDPVDLKTAPIGKYFTKERNIKNFVAQHLGTHETFEVFEFIDVQTP